MTGIEELRRLIRDIEPDTDPVLYYILRQGTEDAHDAGDYSERTLTDELRGILGKIEAEASKTCATDRGEEENPSCYGAGGGCDASSDAEKVTLTDRERRVLEMWPRFEDGELVMVGDKVGDLYGNVRNIDTVSFMSVTYSFYDGDLCYYQQSFGHRVKRPEVLAGDGKPLVRGEHVWHKNGDGPFTVAGVSPSEVTVVGEAATCFEPSELTHEQHDTWERWREDAMSPYDCDYCIRYGLEFGPAKPAKKMKARDLERRARALCERGEE